jgi:hypothetical protein
MFALLHSLAMFGIDFFKPRRRLEVETCSFAINSALP